MDSLNTILSSGTYGDNVSRHNDNNSKIKQAITTLENVAIANKGYFDTLASLQAAFPSPKAGNIAYVANVASSTGYYIYNVVSGVWTATSTEAPAVDVAISNYAQHGYSSSPKTLKQVDDEVSLKANESELFNVSKNLADKSKIIAGTYGATPEIIGPTNNWISILIENLTPSEEYTLSGVHGFATTNNRFRFYSNLGNHISDLNSNGLATQTITMPSNATKVAITIANGLNIGLTPTNNQYANTIQFESGSSATPYMAYGAKVFKLQSVEYPSMFVSLMPYSGTYSGTMISHDIAYIYERIKENRYVRHTLKYEKLEYVDYVSGDFHGGSVVRYAGAKLFTYNRDTGVMTDAGKDLIIHLESEFVMSTGGWSGGYHGNEFMVNVFFVIDGKVHNTNGLVSGFTEITMKEAFSFDYIMASTMNEDTGKTLFCDRTKNVSFVDGGYHVKTKLINIRQAKTTQFYTGISCIGKNLGSVVISEDAGIYVPNGGDDFLFQNKKIKTVYYSSAVNDLSAIVESRIKNQADDDAAVVKLWDRETDTKYYREIYRATVVGEDIEFETKVVVS